MANDLRNIAPGVTKSSISPTANVNVEWPPGVPNYIPGWPFQAATVHIRRMFPGTIIRSLATTHQSRSALPIRPIFSLWETRNTGPKLSAFIRMWPGPGTRRWFSNQNIIVVSGVQNVRPIYGSTTPDTQPGGAIVRPRTRLTSTLRVAAYNTNPPAINPTGAQGGGMGGMRGMGKRRAR